MAVVNWIDFVDAHGPRRRIDTKVRHRRVAAEILADKLAKVAKREHMGVIDDTRVSFGDFADEWLAKVTPRLRPRTAAHWQEIVEKQLKPAFGGALRSVTVARVEAYAARRVEEGVTA